jgi:hypothetical protein
MSASFCQSFTKSSFRGTESDDSILEKSDLKVWAGEKLKQQRHQNGIKANTNFEDFLQNREREGKNTADRSELYTYCLNRYSSEHQE